MIDKCRSIEEFYLEGDCGLYCLILGDYGMLFLIEWWFWAFCFGNNEDGSFHKEIIRSKVDLKKKFIYESSVFEEYFSNSWQWYFHQFSQI